jgi:hypothetical protein
MNTIIDEVPSPITVILNWFLTRPLLLGNILSVALTPVLAMAIDFSATFHSEQLIALLPVSPSSKNDRAEAYRRIGEYRSSSIVFRVGAWKRWPGANGVASEKGCSRQQPASEDDPSPSGA